MPILKLLRDDPDRCGDLFDQKCDTGYKLRQNERTYQRYDGDKGQYGKDHTYRTAAFLYRLFFGFWEIPALIKGHQNIEYICYDRTYYDRHRRTVQTAQETGYRGPIVNRQIEGKDAGGYKYAVFELGFHLHCRPLSR